jgi:lipopolysaccharide/colanic/teichoic acid biosynthesis glycosyltransferase
MGYPREAKGGIMAFLHQTTPHREAVGQTESTVEVLAGASFYRDRAKPFVDVVVGALLLLILAPVTLISMLLVGLSLGRPLIYKQERIGLGGKPFQLYKLRTMIPDRRRGLGGYIGPDRRQTHKSRNDPRVPRTGRILRAVRFDELPQLWNVVKGDMSLVGPRPELPEIVAEYEDWQHRRHDVKPGVTGLWQVSHHNGKPMHECIDVDIEYISAIGLASDVSILLRTPAAMFHRKGY